MIGMAIRIDLYHPWFSTKAEELEVNWIAIKDQGLNNDFGPQQLVVGLALLPVEVHREPRKNCVHVNRLAIASDDHVTAGMRGLDAAR